MKVEAFKVQGSRLKVWGEGSKFVLDTLAESSGFKLPVLVEGWLMVEELVWKTNNNRLRSWDRCCCLCVAIIAYQKLSVQVKGLGASDGIRVKA